MVLMFGALAFSEIDKDHVYVFVARDPSDTGFIDNDKSWKDSVGLSDVPCFVLNHTGIGVQVDDKIAELKLEIAKLKVNDPDECKGEGLCGTKCLPFETCPCLKRNWSDAYESMKATVIVSFTAYCVLFVIKGAFLVAGCFEEKPWDTDMDWWGGWYKTLNNEMIVPLVKGWLTNVLPYMALSPIGGMDSIVVRNKGGLVGTERMYSHTAVRNDFLVVVVLSIFCMVLFLVALGATRCLSGKYSFFGLFPWIFPVASIGMGIYLMVESLTFPPGFYWHLMLKITLQVSFQAYVDAMQLMLFFMCAADAVGGLVSWLNWTETGKSFYTKVSAVSPGSTGITASK